MSPPQPRDPKSEEVPTEPEELRLVGVFAAARSAEERDTSNTLEVGPRWSFSS